MDLLRAGVGAGALLAGIGVFYNYVILVPREQVVAQQRIAQRQRQQKEAQLEKAADKARAQQDLAICLSSAEVDYSINWNNACASRAAQNVKQRRNCKREGMGTALCDSVYSSKRQGCSLPTTMAQSINEFRKSEQEGCYRKAQLEER